MVVTLPHVGQIFRQTIIVILKVFGEDPRKGIGTWYQCEICTGQQQAYSVLGLHQKIGELGDIQYWVWLSGLWIIKSVCLLSFPPGWPFPAYLYRRFNKHLWTTTVYYRYLLGTASFVFSKSCQTLKVRLFPLYDGNPHPRRSGERKKEDDPHMNLCAVLVKDLKKQNAKLNLMA